MLLGVLLILTLGALFFFLGFFAANSPIFGGPASEMSEGGISQSDVDAALGAHSSSISEKVTKILAESAEKVGNTVSQTISELGHPKAQISSDMLLKEIIAAHSENDECSIEKTEENLTSPKAYDADSLQDKKVVFIGYFKNSVALQIQKLLISKGYKVHVEPSKAATGESFIFCGPFKNTTNAQNLAKWLQDHNFSEAKVMNIGRESDDLVYDSLSGHELPENGEEEIPEVTSTELNELVDTAKSEGNGTATTSIQAQQSEELKPIEQQQTEAIQQLQQSEQLPIGI